AEQRAAQHPPWLGTDQRPDVPKRAPRVRHLRFGMGDLGRHAPRLPITGSRYVPVFVGWHLGQTSKAAIFVGWHLGQTSKAAIFVGWHLGQTSKAAIFG